MKRYCVFDGEPYSALGGMSDFNSDFDSEDEALKKANHLFDTYSYNWVQAWDMEENKEIFYKED